MVLDNGTLHRYLSKGCGLVFNWANIAFLEICCLDWIAKYMKNDSNDIDCIGKTSSFFNWKSLKYSWHISKPDISAKSSPILGAASNFMPS